MKFTSVLNCKLLVRQPMGDIFTVIQWLHESFNHEPPMVLTITYYHYTPVNFFNTPEICVVRPFPWRFDRQEYTLAMGEPSSNSSSSSL